MVWLCAWLFVCVGDALMYVVVCVCLSVMCLCGCVWLLVWVYVCVYPVILIYN